MGVIEMPFDVYAVLPLFDRILIVSVTMEVFEMDDQSGEQKCVRDYRKGEMNKRATVSKQMTCSGINEFTKAYQFTALLAWGFCGFPQPKYVEFKRLTVSKSTHTSPIILSVQLLLKIGIDTYWCMIPILKYYCNYKLTFICAPLYSYAPNELWDYKHYSSVTQLAKEL